MSSFGTSPRPFLSPQKVYGLLTKVQNGSAIVFSVFAVTHGVQILGANIGGSSLANNWIMLGRPFYQDEHLEGILVTGSILTHVTAGLAKLGIRLYWNTNIKKNPALLPYHGLTGYLLIPLAGLHYYLVRHLPIDYYGDSAFIDFGYIAWGLQNKPIFTYGLHTALIVAAAYHMVSGAKIAIWGRSKTQLPVANGKVPQHGKSIQQKNINDRLKKRQLIRHGIVATVSVALISSLIIVGRDTKKIPLRLDFAKMYASII
ncbi:hypothetical protein HPULCUR_007883 [Helicostylum pulchrum]|uniref:Mitochondrial adapter protein MCP1 transmembrane domain-containing protein n=1 Tax=Helicostylum pulchrum TaxID=562976 RepID=A0ABP9Y749_9FUNG